MDGTSMQWLSLSSHLQDHVLDSTPDIRCLPCQSVPLLPHASPPFQHNWRGLIGCIFLYNIAHTPPSFCRRGSSAIDTEKTRMRLGFWMGSEAQRSRLLMRKTTHCTYKLAARRRNTFDMDYHIVIIFSRHVCLGDILGADHMAVLAIVGREHLAIIVLQWTKKTLHCMASNGQSNRRRSVHE